MSHSESRWTHDLCGACWNAKRPDMPLRPENAGQGPREICCSCGAVTYDGIPIRAHIDTMPRCPLRAPSDGKAS